MYTHTFPFAYTSPTHICGCVNTVADTDLSAQNDKTIQHILQKATKKNSIKLIQYTLQVSTLNYKG